MPLVYLDTSAFLRRFKTEAGSIGIRSLFQLTEAAARGIVLVTSGMTLNEAAGVLRREHHKNHLTHQEMLDTFAEIIAETGRLVGAGVLRVEGPTLALCRAAAELTILKGCRPPDAIQLHTAVATGCSVLLAADRKLLKHAEAEGLEVHHAADEAELQLWLSSLTP